jgi:hypothetical protein
MKHRKLAYTGSTLLGLVLGGPIIAVLGFLICFLCLHDFTPKKPKK